MAAAVMDGELGKLVKVSAAVWPALWYAQVAAARTRPGLLRLAALLPVVTLFFAVPLVFSTTTFRGSSAFFLSWLGSFKLLLLAAGHGPLHPSLTLLQFVCSASLPVKLQAKVPTTTSSVESEKNRVHRPDSPRAPAKIIVVSGAVIPCIIYAYQFKSGMSRWQLLAMYTAHVYFSLELLLASVHLVIEGALGMEMEPQVDRPYVAASLRDFWGRRWNLMVPAILRPAVYRPVRARLGDAAAVLASFLVSGVMHELMFYYIMWARPTGGVTAFFLLHGACTAAEGWWARHAGWWRPPAVAAVPLTLSFVAATGCWLFFPAMVNGGLDVLVLEECQGMVELMEQAGRWLAAAATGDQILPTQ